MLDYFKTLCTLRVQYMAQSPSRASLCDADNLYKKIRSFQTEEESAQWGTLFTNQVLLFHEEEGKSLGSRRAPHKCAPHCYDLIGRHLPGAELKLVALHVGLQFAAIFCTNS